MYGEESHADSTTRFIYLNKSPSLISAHMLEVFTLVIASGGPPLVCVLECRTQRNQAGKCDLDKLNFHMEQFADEKDSRAGKVMGTFALPLHGNPLEWWIL